MTQKQANDLAAGAVAPPPMRRLLLEARRFLAMTQQELGETLGLSARTIMRWERGQASPDPSEFLKLAAMLRDIDEPELAEELLAASGVIIETRWREGSPEAGAVSVATRHAVDSVLWAAAETMDGTLRQVRPAVLAAFARAKDMGLGIDAVVEALRAATPTPGEASNRDASDPGETAAPASTPAPTATERAAERSPGGKRSPRKVHGHPKSDG
jgi:DNA-binding XRE family transcriptional regulator